MLADGRYWDYGYNDRGEVISGIQNLDGDTPIKGYGFGYAFDSIGNRTGSTVDGTTGSRQTSYVANQVNQYSSITSPGFEYLIGSAAVNATVTGNWTPEGNPPPALQPSDIVQAIRQGNRWYLELGVDNDPGPVWRTAMVRGIVREGADGGAKDALQELQRPLFIPAATQSLGYDADGNMLSDGRWNYSWDGNNRLETVESVPATPDARKRKVEYSYDYMGRMVQRIERSGFDQGSYANSETIVIVYDGWNPVLELDASGTVLKRYYWGLDLSGSLTGAGGVGGLLWMEDVGTSKAYGYCYDGNGNVVGLVNLGDGSIAANYEYGPFGEPIAATGAAAAGNPLRFSTKRTDLATGLLDFGRRHYHPELGRWISSDPIGIRGGAHPLRMLAYNATDCLDYLGLFVRDGPYKSSRAYASVLEAAHAAGVAAIAFEHHKALESVNARRGYPFAKTTTYFPVEHAGRICCNAGKYGITGRPFDRRRCWPQFSPACNIIGKGWLQVAFWHSHPGEFNSTMKPPDFGQPPGFSGTHPSADDRSGGRGDTDLVDDSREINPLSLPFMMTRMLRNGGYETTAYYGHGRYERYKP